MIKDLAIYIIINFLRMVTLPFSLILLGILSLFKIKLKDNEDFMDFYENLFLWSFAFKPITLLPLSIVFYIGVISLLLH